MNAKIRKTLMASMIATMMSTPVWAADPATTGSPATGAQSTDSKSMERSTTGTAGSTSQLGSADASNPLYSMTPQQLRRMEVVDATGDEIGKVQSVVRSRDEENIQLVVSSGGFLGVGGKDVAIPLNEVSLVGDKLHLSSSKAELEARPKYEQEQYVELQPADQPISDFAAFEPVPGQESQPGRSGSTGSSSDMGAGSSSSPATGSGAAGSGTTGTDTYRGSGSDSGTGTGSGSSGSSGSYR